MGGENGHPHPRRVDGALLRCRSQGRGACAAGAFFRTSVFEMGGACFKEPGPVIFASGGGGTDFTLYSTLATFRPDLCTIPQPTVSTALAVRPRHAGTVSFSTCALCWTGFGFQANTVEEYVLLSAFFFLHTFVGLKRTWDQKLSSGRSFISSDQSRGH